jgi:hypothetical protein
MVTKEEAQKEFNGEKDIDMVTLINVSWSYLSNNYCELVFDWLTNVNNNLSR